MASVPNEVLSLIFELACSDDGSTAKALTSVSHRFHAVVQPFLYTTIRVEGQEQVRAVQVRLDSRAEHLRRVRHAFISDWTREQICDHESNPELFDDDYERGDAEAVALARLIDTIAPTVYTLTFITSNTMTSTTLCARLLATSFPQLEQLTLKGFYPYPCANTMPRLRVLHLSGNRNPHGLLQLGSLPDAFPSLTHLRVSGLSGAVSFANELKEAFSAGREELGEDDPFGWSMDSMCARLPVNLTTLQVQPSNACQALAGEPRSGRRGKMEERMANAFRELDNSLSVQDDPTASFVVLSAPKERESEFDVLEKEWVALLNGVQPENRNELDLGDDYTGSSASPPCALHW